MPRKKVSRLCARRPGAFTVPVLYNELSSPTHLYPDNSPLSHPSESHEFTLRARLRSQTRMSAATLSAVILILVVLESVGCRLPVLYTLCEQNRFS